MDRNSILGLVLIFVILITFAYINQPSDQDLKLAKIKRDSVALVQQQTDSIALAELKTLTKRDSILAPDTNNLKNSFGDFAHHATGTESFTTLENEDLKITFTNKGGRIEKVELKKYKRSNQEPLVLMEGPNNEFSYSFATVDNKAISTGELYFDPILDPNGKGISMRLQLAPDQYIEHHYLLDSASMVKLNINLIGLGSVVATNHNYLDLTWKQHILQQEKTQEAEAKTSTIYYRYAEDEPANLSESKDAKEELKTPIQWIDFKQQYFNMALIAEKNFDNGVVETKADETQRTVKQMTANLILPYNHGEKETIALKFYFGPNHYKTLTGLNIALERIVPMGWGIFGWVNKYLTANVFYWLGQYITSFGLIIFLLTLIVKTILFPLVYRSYLSSAKMRVLKPEIDAIKDKYGSDMAKLQQENMKIYRKAGVNPMGGCVPVLLQMPILIAMFQFFPTAFELRQKAFLWSHDLSTFDSIYDLPFKIPFYGDHVSLFTLMMTASTLVYTMYNNQMTGVTGQMKVMSYIMPIMFLGFFNSYSSGLTYYYFVSNLFTIGQQLLIRSFVDEKAIHAQLQENKKKPVTKSKFQLKLEEMAKKRGFDTDKLTGK